MWIIGEKGRRIRELTSVVQKRFKFPENSVELYAEKVNNRGLCAIAQAESLRYKLLGGLAVRRYILEIVLFCFFLQIWSLLCKSYLFHVWYMKLDHISSVQLMSAQIHYNFLFNLLFLILHCDMCFISYVNVMSSEMLNWLISHVCLENECWRFFVFWL